jgi:hypothetical protein
VNWGHWLGVPSLTGTLAQSRHDQNGLWLCCELRKRYGWIEFWLTLPSRSYDCSSYRSGPCRTTRTTRRRTVCRKSFSRQAINANCTSNFGIGRGLRDLLYDPAATAPRTGTQNNNNKDIAQLCS